MKLEELKGKKILILGYGKEGQATERFLRAKMPAVQIKIADKQDGANYLEKQNDVDLVVKTPGIQKKYITKPYTTAANLFFANVGSNTIIGVTGSKGKSTTASLIYEILQKAGKKVHLVGNIGNPALDELLKPYGNEDIFVMELSSYQLDDMQYSPHIAVSVSLFPDHINYHGSVEDYYQSKQNIIRFSKPDDYFVYNPEFSKLQKWANEAQCKPIPYDQQIPVSNEEIPLLGEHNKKNIQAAVTVARLCGVNDSIIKEAIKQFKPLPHRLEYVGEYEGIDFYDDAISTTPESTIAAIKTLEKVQTIFLGGENRGYDFSQLADVLKHSTIENIVFFPDSGKEISETFEKAGVTPKNILQTKSMKDSVDFAFSNTKKGMICLLSTASPSYSLWKNFEEKGDEFQNYVKTHKS